MRKFGLAGKIGLTVLPLIAAMILTVAIGLIEVANLSKSFRVVAREVLPNVQQIDDIQTMMGELAVMQKKSILSPTGPRAIETKKRWDDIVVKLLKAVDTWEKSASTDTRNLIAKFKPKLSEYIEIQNQVMQLLAKSDVQGANELSESKASASRRQMLGLLKEEEETVGKEFASAVARAEHIQVSSRVKLILTAFIAGLIALAIAFSISRSLIVLFNQIVDGLTSNSHALKEMAKQMALQSSSLSSAASQQAAGIQETAAAADQMNSIVSRNTETASKTSRVSSESEKSVHDGKSVVGKMMGSLKDIDRSTSDILQQVNESNKRIAEISVVIGDISAKTKVINDIVFQTKLLSFNASVEAARAGEQGKGFAVVAEEVGNLAQMSGNAAQEISSMLQASIQKVEMIVQETRNQVSSIVEESRQKVEAGIQIGSECERLLDEIVIQVSQASRMSSEIASASGEQSQAVGEITKAIGQMDLVTQQNAKSSEECAKTAQLLEKESERLESSVESLLGLVHGRAHSV